ncbi:MAG: hypothetical protein K6G52_00570 [Treponemataceae bacterium]|nr:hypothetical protein [Treponemataceae bacterium]
MKGTVKKFLAFLFCTLFATLAFAQSADFISEVIATQKITYGQAAYFICCDYGYIDEAADESSAVSALEENFPNMINKLKIQQVDKELTVKEFSFMCCQAWDIKSSLMYMIFQNQRYAFKQMKAKGYFAANTNPNATLDGRKVLYIISDFAGDKKVEKKPAKAPISADFMISR